MAGYCEEVFLKFNGHKTPGNFLTGGGVIKI